MGRAGEFLKKRAPFYLAGAALLAVFVVPELTRSGLEGSFPELGPGEQAALDALMGHRGPGGSLTVLGAISMLIEDEYPGERIYDDRRTEVFLAVTEEGAGYRIVLDFASYRGSMHYDWSVGSDGAITPNSPDARHVMDIVKFY